MPEMYRELERNFEAIGESTKGIFERLPKGVQNGWHALSGNLNDTVSGLVGRISEPTVTAAGNFAMRIPSILIAVIVTFISAYFFIAERDEVIVWVKKITPDPIARRMGMVMDNLKYAVGGYFKDTA